MPITNSELTQTDRQTDGKERRVKLQSAAVSITDLTAPSTAFAGEQ